MNSNASSVSNKPNAPVRGGGERGASPTTLISGLVLNHTQEETAYKQALINNLKQQNGTNVNSIYTQRLTIYGNSLLLITYNTPQFTHTNPTRQDYSQSPSSRRSDSLWRTRNYISMLCTANVDANPLYRPVFLTLTFKNNITDLTQANYHYKLFIQRLNYLVRTQYSTPTTTPPSTAAPTPSVLLSTPTTTPPSTAARYNSLASHTPTTSSLPSIAGSPSLASHTPTTSSLPSIAGSLKYIAVVEFQRRGAIHYHCVFFNLPFIPKEIIETTWSHGFSNIRIAKNINDVTRYVSKYMSKQLLDRRLVGQKAYFCSRGLQRPKTYYLQNSIDNVLKNVKLNLTEVITKPSYQIKKFRI